MIKGICIGNLALDCENAAAQQAFYEKLLGWKKQELYGCPALVSGDSFVLLFMPCDFPFTPPVWPEQPGTQQKQMHFDFQVDDLASAVTEAESFGAVKAASQYGGDEFVTLIDPEGHPFCLCAKG